jgi:hypothetical protein
MFAAPPPVVVQGKKRGLGCFGGGCVAVLIVLALVLVVGGCLGYYGFHRALAMTSETPATIPTFDGGGDLFQSTTQKLEGFGRELEAGRPADLELTADELNTLIARSPDLAANQIHLFVTMNNDQANVLLSLPTDLLPGGMLKGRYINGEAALSPGFDPDSKSLDLGLRRFKIGDLAVPASDLPLIESQLKPALNMQMQNSPSAKQFLDHAKTIEIRGGKLEIETR